MDRFDPAAALEELNEEARLPNPVHMRDLLLRAHLEPKDSLELNRQFTEYQKHFAEALKLGKSLLAESWQRGSCWLLATSTQHSALSTQPSALST
jgi:hypothetical protein